jgi:hypothetical protein
MRVSRVRALIAAVSCAVALAGAGSLATNAHAATSNCTVEYAVGPQWPGSFIASVGVTAQGAWGPDPTLTWRFSAGQVITNAWNAVVEQTGANVRIELEASNWNGNGTAPFGFSATWTGSNPPPEDVTLDGTPCTLHTRMPSP